MEKEEIKNVSDLKREISRLRNKLKLTEESLQAAHDDKIDAYIKDISDKDNIVPPSGDTLYRLLVERMTEGAVVVNNKLDIVFCNSRFSQFVNRPLQKIIGANLSEFINPSELDRIFYFINAPIKESIQQEIKLVSAKNRSFICSFTSFYQEDESYYSFIFTDVTQQKIAEKQIKTSEKKWRTLVENIPDIIVQFDREKRYRYVNSAFEKITGLQSFDVIGKTPLHIARNGKLADQWIANLEKTFSEKKLNESTLVFHSAKHEYYSFNTLFVPQFDEKGKVNSVLTISRDITEIRKKEEQLNEVNTKLKAAQNLAKVGSWDWNVENGEITWSDQHYQLWGINDIITPLTLDFIFSRIHPEDVGVIKQVFQDPYKVHGSFEYEHRVIWPSGEIRFFRGRGDVMKDDSGKNIRIYGVNHDITEIKDAQNKILSWNKQLEEKVEERTREIGAAKRNLDQALVREKNTRLQVETERKRLYDLFMDAPGMICLLKGPDMVYEFLNPAYQKIFPERKLLNKPILEVIPEIENQDIYQVLKNVYEKGEAYYGDEFYLAINDDNGGSQGHYFNFVYQPYRNIHNQIDGILVYAYEVTDLVKARITAEENEKKFRLVIEALPLIAWSSSSYGKIDYLNSSWYYYTGMKEEDPIEIWEEFFEVSGIKELRNSAQEALKTKEPYDLQLKIKGKTNQYRWHLIKVMPAFDTDNRITRWIGTATDIHDQITKTKELDQKNIELHEINKYLDNFVHTIAHDFRTPVANLKLTQEVFKEAHETQKQELYEVISKNVDKLDIIMKGLVQIIDMQGDKPEYEHDLNVEDIINEVLQDESSSFRKNNASVEIKKYTQPIISYAKAYLWSIIKNMVSNALKYAFPQRNLKLIINLKRDERFFIMEFEDNGIGIDLKKYKKNLFHPFQRFSDNTQGMGIGLHIINTMVAKNGGHIDVESIPGNGSKFKVFIKEYN